MDPFKYASIAHADLDLVAPISLERLDRVVDLLELHPDARVLDLSCGKGEVLIRVCERWGATGVGLDPSPSFLAAARAEAAARLPDGAVELQQVEPFELEVEPESYDLVIAMGARPFGDFRGTLAQTWPMVRSGGMLLVGDTYWRQEPDPDYLDALGIGPDSNVSHAENVALAVAESFTPLYCVAAGHAEIDHYEGMCNRSVERFLRASPGDSHADAFREYVRHWRDAYLKWGRAAVGYGLYLLLK
ncbi:MAG: methyltransferase domain-containing protein [Deltaproteobacteria bacterium]|nr:MAG: methyltransferase domain-containing protein [Deltaproteobacteria bacterium]